jgi:hypothetical protein
VISGASVCSMRECLGVSGCVWVCLGVSGCVLLADSGLANRTSFTIMMNPESEVRVCGPPPSCILWNITDLANALHSFMIF